MGHLRIWRFGNGDAGWPYEFMDVQTELIEELKGISAMLQGLIRSLKSKIQQSRSLRKT